MADFGLGFIKVNVDWPTMKSTATAKYLSIQYNDTGSEYEVFALDAQVAYICVLFKNKVPQSSYIDQATNDTYKTEFEAIYKNVSNKPILAKDGTGKVRTISEKTTASRVSFYSHDWTDPTTWYSTSVRVVDEIATNSGDNKKYILANQYIIDTYHGKLTGEDYYVDKDGYSYRVSVKVNNSLKIEQDPHYGAGNDYIVDYYDGYINFISALNPSDVVKVTYHKMVDSSFTIKPLPGQQLTVISAEVQFSADVIVNDSAVFQAYGLVDVFAPQLIPGIPSGTLIPLKNPVVYKSMSDYQNDANKAYPTYPALGGSGWRGLSQPIIIFDWDYAASTPLRADYGMQIVIKLQHNTPFGGTYGTATFYCTTEPLI